MVYTNIIEDAGGINYESLLPRAEIVILFKLYLLSGPKNEEPGFKCSLALECVQFTSFK